MPVGGKRHFGTINRPHRNPAVRVGDRSQSRTRRRVDNIQPSGPRAFWTLWNSRFTGHVKARPVARKRYVWTGAGGIGLDDLFALGSHGEQPLVGIGNAAVRIHDIEKLMRLVMACFMAGSLLAA